jgi:hypothetical protein
VIEYGHTSSAGALAKAGTKLISWFAHYPLPKSLRIEAYDISNDNTAKLFPILPYLKKSATQLTSSRSRTTASHDEWNGEE